MIPCWIVEVTYETQGDNVRVMQSEPLTFTEARNLVVAYERRGHQARVIELEPVTEIHRKVLAAEIDRRRANALLRDLYDQMPQSRRASRRERQEL